MSRTPGSKGGPSLNPAGRPRKHRKDTAIVPARRDGWTNILTGLGSTTYDKRRSTTFELAEVINHAGAAELWRGDDLAARVIETWPDEMLRRGFELHVTSDDATLEDAKPKGAPAEGPDAPEEKGKGKPPPFGRGDRRRDAEEEAAPPPAKKSETGAAGGKDDVERVTDHWKELGLVEALWRALAYSRAYGGGAILLGVNDGQDLTKPLDLERVIEFTFLTVLEPRECSPIAWYADPRAPKYGEAAIYQLSPTIPGTPHKANFSAGTVQVHESRLIIFQGIQVSNAQLSGTLSGWGDSVLTRIWKVLRDFNVSWASAALLLQDFAQAVYGVKGLAELIASDKDQEIMARMQIAERQRSTARAIMIDSEETFERKQTPMSGMPEMLELFATRFAAAADMPVTRLFGISPGGLNATGESDIRLFYDRVSTAQERKLLPPLERIARLTFKALGIAEPKSWAFKFRPLWQPTDKERAEARKITAETDKIYIEAGVLSPEEVAVSRFGGDEYSAETIVDFEARAMLQPAAEAPAKTTQQIEDEEREAEEKAAQFELAAKKVEGSAKPAVEK